MDAKGAMERTASAWETYDSCRTSLQTWLADQTISGSATEVHVSEWPRFYRVSRTLSAADSHSHTLMCLVAAGCERVVRVPRKLKQGGEPSHRDHRSFHQPGPGAAAQQRQQAVGQMHEEDRVCTCSCLLQRWQKSSG